MSDQEKPETPPTVPAADSPAPQATADAPPADAPASGPTGAPSQPSAPGRSGPPGRGGPGKKDKPKRDFGAMPNRRMREAVPSLVDADRFGHGPKIHDLDTEIEGELEAAMAGMSQDQLLAADSSKNVQQAAAATAEGGRKQGKVLSIHGPDVFIDVPGGRSQGVMSLLQFPDGPPAPGTVVEFSIEGYDRANGLLLLTRAGAAVVADWSSVAEGQTVEAKVVSTNKGGLSVDINGIRGFMPISQIDLYRVENAEPLVNQKLLCLVTEVNQQERNLVVSRRALLERERDEQREKLWGELAEGQVRQGIVRSVRDFGAFVDLGGADGLLHVGEMSWKRVGNPAEVVQAGQSVKVVVLRVDRENRKISLGMKQLEASPWDDIQQRFSTGMTVEGKVTRLMDFGAFIELEPGVEGLAHISELGRQKVWRVKDVVNPGDTVTVKILGVDTENRRISLSVRQALPQEVVKPSEDEEDDADVPVEPIKPRTTPLRGGIGQQWTLPTPEEQGGE